MSLNFVDIMLVVLFFQLLSISPYLLLEKGNNNRKYLGFFLLAKALCISNFLSFRLFDFTYENFPHLFYFGSSFTILWGPLLFFYVKSISIKDFNISKKDLIHFTPFLIHFMYLLIVFHLHGAEYKREMVMARNVFPGISNLIVYIMIEVSIGIYTFYSMYLIWKFGKSKKENYSSADQTNINWLWFIILGFFAKWFSDSVYFVFAVIGIGGTEIILSFSKIFLFVFVNYMIYKGFKQPEIFSGIEEAEVKKSSLSESVLEDYKSRLGVFMDEEKPYLDPELSLTDLSKLSKIPSRSLSEVINNGFGQNFYDFVNRYRIKESERLLCSYPENPKTVLEVLYEAGFKSKSSFHKAFNKHTGMTPSQFRMNQKN